MGGPAYGGFDGTYEKKVKYLKDDILDLDVPKWAYLTAVFGFQPYSDKKMNMIVKIPDGADEAGRMMIYSPPNFNDEIFDPLPEIFGGNDRIIMPGRFDPNGSPWGVPAAKGQDGTWLVTTAESLFTEPVVNEALDFGGPECHPIVADFDGDGFSDQTVMCPDEWRIMYSDDDYAAKLRDVNGFREIPLGYDESEFSLPGRSYAGGISYSYARQLMKMHKVLYPTKPVPIMVDMVTVMTTK
jgi:hypothetical protein